MVLAPSTRQNNYYKLSIGYFSEKVWIFKNNIFQTSKCHIINIFLYYAKYITIVRTGDSDI